MSDVPQFAIIGAPRRRDHDMPQRPLMEAQADELRRRYRELTTPSDLKPGDLCVEKDGLGTLRPEARPSCLYILLRLLDHSDWFDQQLMARRVEAGSVGLVRLDCLVAMVTDCGLTIDTFPHQLGQLRRWDGDTEGAAVAQQDAA